MYLLPAHDLLTGYIKFTFRTGGLVKVNDLINISINLDLVTS